MSTGTLIILGAIGVGAVYLLLRNGQQQQAAVSAAAGSAPAPSDPHAGGGVSGLATRLVTQWRGDPLGIKNAQAVALGIGGVVTSGVHEVSSLISPITHLL